MTTDESWDRFLEHVDEYQRAKGRVFLANLQQAVELDRAFHAEERRKFEDKAKEFWEALNG